MLLAPDTGVLGQLTQAAKRKLQSLRTPTAVVLVVADAGVAYDLAQPRNVCADQGGE